jgi:hypothetical protein
MLAATAGDVHPPLYYLLNWALYRVLPFLPAWGVRLVSLLASLGGIVMLRQVLLQANASPRLQTASLGLMALVPQQIIYASEARMYSCLGLLVLAGYWSVRARRWVLAWLFVTLLAYTNNWGLFYGLTLGILALATAPRHWKQIVLAFGLAALCWLPWLAILTGQMHSIAQTYWITTVSFPQVLLAIYNQVWSNTLTGQLSMAATFTWLLLGVGLMRRQYGLLLMAFLPVLIGLIVSLLWQPVLIERPVMGSAPFLYILLGSVLEQAWPRSRQDLRRLLVAGITILPMFVMAYRAFYGSLDSFRVNYLPEIAYVEQHWQAGDMLAIPSDSVVDWLPYIHQPVWFVKPCQESLNALTDQTRQAIGYEYTTWQALKAPRVWLVGMRIPIMRQCAIDEINHASAGARLVKQRDLGSMTFFSLWLLEGSRQPVAK